MVLYQGIIIPLVQFNTFCNCNLLGASLTAATSQEDPNNLLSHVSQQLRKANIGSFVGIQEESNL